MEMNPSLKNISKKFGTLEIFRDLSVSFLSGRINCILGPSGCGKTTLLNIINGSVRAEKGDWSDFQGLKISYVFQDPRLLPWKTVKENIAFVLKDRLKGEELENRLNRHIQRVELENFSHYYPSRLSGGMKQRVSLARAFSCDPELILMDEPFKGLDVKLKSNLTRYFLDLWKSDRQTVIFVTHDVEEAVSLGDRIIILGQPPSGLLRIYEKEQDRNAGGLIREITALMGQ